MSGIHVRPDDPDLPLYLRNALDLLEPACLNAASAFEDGPVPAARDVADAKKWLEILLQHLDTIHECVPLLATVLDSRLPRAGKRWSEEVLVLVDELRWKTMGVMAHPEFAAESKREFADRARAVAPQFTQWGREYHVGWRLPPQGPALPVPAAVAPAQDQPAIAIRATPPFRLLDAMNSLVRTLSTAHIFADLAKRRKQARTLFADNAVSLKSQEPGSEADKGGQTRLDGLLTAFSQLNAVKSSSPPFNEPSEFTEQLKGILRRGREGCKLVRAALRDGGALGMDRTLAANSMGQVRSIEIHTRVQQAENVLTGLSLATINPSTVMDRDVEEMTTLREWFVHTGQELIAVIETVGLSGQSGSPATKETASSVGGASPAANVPPEPLDGAWLSETDLARVGGVSRDSLRTKLRHWRPKHMNNEWQRVPNPRPNEPKYLYRWSAVKPVIDELAKTGRKPAAKNRKPKAR